ncbi:hypothetical protein GQ53DRAFT_424944 [Thozetella sp. PMI_491]|nr:hypothetical protein GQ53DRAFT_424944 [Thozetella sp. PMI_491]
MADSAVEGTSSLARQSCSICKRQKRKCSRELPKCELCRRHLRQCQYPFEGLPGQNSGPQDPEPCKALSLFFLDSDTFSRRQPGITPAAGFIPADILDSLVDGRHLDRDAEAYFASVHEFFPIVSKTRFHQLMSSISELQMDILLLLLAMRLLCSPVDKDRPISALYSSTKRCLMYAEMSGALTLRALQASVLIALYEVANAIYPAAYLSVGNCARMGYALGYHDRRTASQLHPPPRSWTELEEVRRVWWAIYILDRYTNVGIDHRPFCREEAKSEELLPTDETLWESGEQAPIQSLAVSASADVAASPFARTCQASHLLSLVIRHINTKPTDMREFYEEGIQLHQVLNSFRLALLLELASTDDRQFGPFSSAVGICYSGLIALYDRHSCAEVDDPAGVGIPQQLQLQEIALSGLKELSGQVAEFAIRLNRLTETYGVMAAGPFVADCFYAMLRLCMAYYRETRKPAVPKLVLALKGGLQATGGHWAAANKYLAILEDEE